jgi:hypothetical protein
MASKKVIDLSVYSALDQYAIGLNEYFKSLRRAGFSVDHALYLITAPQTYPATILPQPNWLPDQADYSDYEDDED